jgi:hypothetical protein
MLLTKQPYRQTQNLVFVLVTVLVTFVLLIDAGDSNAALQQVSERLLTYSFTVRNNEDVSESDLKKLSESVFDLGKEQKNYGILAERFLTVLGKFTLQYGQKCDQHAHAYEDSKTGKATLKSLSSWVTLISTDPSMKDVSLCLSENWCVEGKCTCNANRGEKLGGISCKILPMHLCPISDYGGDLDEESVQPQLIPSLAQMVMGPEYPSACESKTICKRLSQASATGSSRCLCVDSTSPHCKNFKEGSTHFARRYEDV